MAPGFLDFIGRRRGMDASTSDKAQTVSWEVYTIERPGDRGMVSTNRPSITHESGQNRVVENYFGILFPARFPPSFPRDPASLPMKLQRLPMLQRRKAATTNPDTYLKPAVKGVSEPMLNDRPFTHAELLPDLRNDMLSQSTHCHPCGQDAMNAKPILNQKKVVSSIL